MSPETVSTGADWRSAGPWDAVVVGGGHNGLVNGAYLARAGLRTLILERRPVVGGAAITEELRPGFQFTTFSYALSLVRPAVIHELDLVAHGFQPLVMPSTFCPMENGDALVLGPDRGENLTEIARHSRRDADAWLQYQHDLTMVARALQPVVDAAPPDLLDPSPEARAELVALARHLGGLEPKVLHDLVRLLTGSAADFLDHYFETEILKGWLSASGVIGSRLGPMSPGSGLVLLFMHLGQHDGDLGSWAFHKGGNGGFTQVLARAARAFGAEIATGAEVDRVLTAGGRATGVALADGTEVGARVVVSAADPRTTFTRLVDPAELPAQLVSDLGRYRYQGVSSKVNFALDGLPRFPGLTDGRDHWRGFTNIAPSVEYVERAFDEAKYGWYSTHPFIDCAVQSILDPDMAPPGRHVLSCFVQYTPYELKGGASWEAEREPMADRVQATLARFFPGFDDLVLQREVVTPLDIEQVAGLPEGNIYHGELLAPQLWSFRPAPGWARYRTPIGGYYQCGSGTHPGGCLTGAPGRLASQAILADLAHPAAARRP